MINIITIIYFIIDFLNTSFNELFFFVPEILRIFALSLVLLMITHILDKFGTKKAKIVRIIINTLFGIYAFFRLVPIQALDGVNMEYISYSDLAIIIISLFPYFSIILLGKYIKKNRIVSFFINYHVLHILFLLLVFAFNYYDTDLVNLRYSVWFVGMCYSGNLLFGLGGKND